ncbi:M15 family metallopeptidase [Gaetbulibacter saemankumensis]|uniref:M15 family metallopeptidase n=1 Tax=Gaetbulibacter saemankumensis TaxID=311208 RepID=UPI00041BFB98|nr:M15 family metallopeptidase [Gaetbulibacter saemankumensis]
MPDKFVYATEVIPNLDVELRYYSTDNFVGTSIEGYNANRLILTYEAAVALKRVQEELKKENLCLRVYDGYRPQRAVNHFIDWAKDLNDTINKAVFYPELGKEFLFQEEYIATRSGHSKGSTVDLTIIDGNTGEPLDMGSSFDYFGEISGIYFNNLTSAQKQNRKKLLNIMRKHGFRNYPKEWWHYTLRHEPFPSTYFDFPIE